jgi:hypothetical protein
VIPYRLHDKTQSDADDEEPRHPEDQFHPVHGDSFFRNLIKWTQENISEVPFKMIPLVMNKSMISVPDG